MANQAGAEGEGGEGGERIKISADGFVDYSQWADLRGSEALSKANPSGQRTLLGDGECLRGV